MGLMKSPRDSVILSLIYFITTINSIITSGTKPVVSLYASKMGASAGEIGVIVAMFAILPAFLAIHIGKWIDRYGIRTLVSFGGFSLLISLILPLAYPHFISFVLSQAIMGIGFTCQIVALQKRVGQTAGDMDKRIATFSLFGSLGALVGPSFSSILYDHFGFQVSYSANAVLMVLGAAAVYLVKRSAWEVPKKEAAAGENKGPQKSVWSMLRQRGLRNAVIISGLMLSGKEIFSAYFPLLGEKMGISPTMIGIILSFMSLASMASRFSQPYLVRRFGRSTVLTWALFISGIIYAVTPSVPFMVALIVLIGVLGAGLGLGQPLSLSYAIQVSPPERRGEVLGMRITFNRVSQFSIPLLFGGLGGMLGVIAIFWASGALLLIGGLLTRAKPSDSVMPGS
ncbi:MFS transporter [Paenibacillus thalictri]|uniref:MFS transporter n=1 Tax=Paenibacillus thalictri TaxID=2527873 RepID=A0A4Q9DS06_9BACL|nr:MFS transporter [Paenibacillus thalictri]TBL77830.1 MFS transporter [Paenibacillus thalictri]